MELDKKLITADKLKDGILDGVSKLPNFLSDKLFGLLELLMKLPFIGALIAGFLGYGSVDSALEGTREEVRRRKSLNALREYGKKKKKKGNLKS